MSCKTCSELQKRIGFSARELSRAVHDAHVATEPFAGMAAGNRIVSAKYGLKIATDAFEQHQQRCKFHSDIQESSVSSGLKSGVKSTGTAAFTGQHTDK